MMKKLLTTVCLLLIINMTYTQSERLRDTFYYIRPNSCGYYYTFSEDTLYTNLIDKKIKAVIQVDLYYKKKTDVLLKTKAEILKIFDYETNKILYDFIWETAKDTSEYANLIPFLDEYSYKRMSQATIIRKQKRRKECSILPSYIIVQIFPLHKLP